MPIDGHTPLIEWAPGSMSLAVAVRAVEGRSNVYVFDFRGARPSSRRVATRRNTVTGLSWSPDGRRLAYALDSAGVYVVSADGTGTRRLEATGDGVGIAGPSWSPRGNWVAYVTETVTGATRLSLASPDGKQQRRLAVGVTSSRPAWAPTGASVAVPARGGLLMAQPSGAKRRVAVSGLLRDLAWSPDGGGIAFARGPATNVDETVGVLELRTGRVTTLAPQKRADVIGRPSWTPDSRTLVYLSKVYAADSEILAVQPDGTDVEVLTHNGVDDTQPAASPDGSTIAFVRRGSNGGIFLIDADGGNQRRLTRGGMDPAWSPDGKQLAYARVDARNPDRTHVYVRSLAGTAERRLPGPGARIAYTHPADILPKPPFEGVAFVGYTSHPAWSPDGREIAFAGTVSGTTDLFAVGTDGTGLRRVTRRVASQDHFWPEWSSSGKLAYVAGDLADTPSLWVQFGGRVWQDMTPSFATRPAWSPDGSLLVLGGVGPQRLAVTVAPDGRQTTIPD